MILKVGMGTYERVLMKWDNETLNFDDFLPVETASLPLVKSASPSLVQAAIFHLRSFNPALSKETIMASQESCLTR